MVVVAVVRGIFGRWLYRIVFTCGGCGLLVVACCGADAGLALASGVVARYAIATRIAGVVAGVVRT